MRTVRCKLKVLSNDLAHSRIKGSQKRSPKSTWKRSVLIEASLGTGTKWNFVGISKRRNIMLTFFLNPIIKTENVREEIFKI